jgi:hypothetical protein
MVSIFSTHNSPVGNTVVGCVHMNTAEEGGTGGT